MGGLHKLPSNEIPGPRELISGGLQHRLGHAKNTNPGLTPQ